MKTNFTYDVAFSFLAEDEKLALDLYNLLNESLKCFIYTEEQKKLAGTDGEKTFNNVFFKEARVVVILYRKNWGKTSWTRIEETAIRNRGHEEGYDFALLIPLDRKPTPPIWFPKNRLWIGLERWGIESAASVIEARVQEQGGEPILLSLADKIQAQQKVKEKREENIKFLNSAEGRNAEKQEIEKLKNQFKEEIQKIKDKSPKFHLHHVENSHKGLNIYSNGYQIYFHYYTQIYPNYLFFGYAQGYTDEKGISLPMQDFEIIITERYNLNIDIFDQKGWSIKDSDDDFKTTNQMVQYWLEKLLKLKLKE